MEKKNKYLKFVPIMISICLIMFALGSSMAYSNATTQIKNTDASVEEIKYSTREGIGKSAPNSFWLERYQTLITGFIAIITTFIGLGGLIWVTWYNAAEERKRENRKINQKQQSMATSIMMEMNIAKEFLENTLAITRSDKTTPNVRIRYSTQVLKNIKLPITESIMVDIGILGPKVASIIAQFSTEIILLNGSSLINSEEELELQHSQKLLNIIISKLEVLIKCANDAEIELGNILNK